MPKEATIHWEDQLYRVNWAEGRSIALPLRSGRNNPKAWHAIDPSFSPVQEGTFIGHIKAGGSVNFFDVRFNPHGNGTHTECIGHITAEHHSLCDCPIQPIAVCQLISVTPAAVNRDHIITEDQVMPFLHAGIEAIAIRTLPNNSSKQTHNYSNSNPAYFEASLLGRLADEGLQHLLTDLPSVDRAEDGGALAAHKAWWRYPTDPRMAATITEMTFVPDSMADGIYLLNLMVPQFALDAAPSQPILYPLHPING